MMKLQQSFQLLELVQLPLVKKNWRKEIGESTVVSKTQLQVPLFIMNILASAKCTVASKTHKLSFMRFSIKYVTQTK